MGSDLPACEERPSQGASTPHVQPCSSEDQCLVLLVCPAADSPPSTPFQRHHVRCAYQGQNRVKCFKLTTSTRPKKDYKLEVPHESVDDKNRPLHDRDMRRTSYQCHHTHISQTRYCRGVVQDITHAISNRHVISTMVKKVDSEKRPILRQGEG